MNSERTLLFEKESIEAFVDAIGDNNPIHRGAEGVVPGFMIAAALKQHADAISKLSINECALSMLYAAQRTVFRKPAGAGIRFALSVCEDERERGLDCRVYDCVLLNSDSEVIVKSQVAYRRSLGQTRQDLSSRCIKHTMPAGSLEHACKGLARTDKESYCISLATLPLQKLGRELRWCNEGSSVMFRWQEVRVFDGLRFVEVNKPVYLTANLERETSRDSVRLSIANVLCQDGSGECLYSLRSSIASVGRSSA